MRELLSIARDIWCVVTSRCRVSRHDDPLIDSLLEHEQEAWRQVSLLRSSRKTRDALIRSGATEYRELNRAMFGREPWPRERFEK